MKNCRNLDNHINCALLIQEEIKFRFEFCSCVPFSFHFLTNTVNVEQYNQDILILDFSKERVFKVY